MYEHVPTTKFYYINNTLILNTYYSNYTLL